MGTYCMIVGTELALHREVLAGSIGLLRPAISLHVMEPEQLRLDTPCRAPRLVIASDRETIARLRPFASILLFPDDADIAVATIDGATRVIANASIADILSVVDLVWSSPTGASPAEPTRG